MATAPAPPPLSHFPTYSVRFRWLAFTAFIFAATFVAYLPAVQGGFIWDDDAHVTSLDLRSLHGLWRIWTELGATQQYYPLLHSAFWIQYKLWGDWTPGYHLVNVLLHATSACLIWRILRHLNIPGAALAAIIFALHPVHVESVAWISELKNTLSGVFYLSSALIYLRFDQQRRRSLYLAALALFVLALLTKTVTATLPASLLLIFWWQRGRLSWARDVLPLVPWLILGFFAGIFTAWVEHRLIGASGARFDFSYLQRVVLSGRVIWFYLGKLVWPTNLIFIYPRWSIGRNVGWQWIAPAGVIALVSVLWAIRRLTRAPLAAFLLFAGTLFPALGFFNVYPFRYSFVADHFQYLASLGIIALASASIRLALNGLSAAPRLIGQVVCAGLVIVLSALTFLQGRMYGDIEKLYATTIEKNPAAFMPRYNLGTFLSDAGRWHEAVPVLESAISMAVYDEDRARAHGNLGNALVEVGRPQEAIAHEQESLRLKPDTATALVNLGNALSKVGRTQEAIESFQRAIHIDANDARAHYDLGTALVAMGRTTEAIEYYRQAVQIDPGFAEAHNNLGAALFAAGQKDEAIRHFQRATQLKPGYSTAFINLASALNKVGQPQQAATALQQAIRLDPRNPEARTALASTLFRTGRAKEAIEQYRAAAQLNPDSAEAHTNLGTALVAVGQTKEAAEQYQRAFQIKPDDPLVCNNLAWIYAEDPDPKNRNAPEAIRLAERAVQLTAGKDPRFLETLSIAYAAAGRTSDAVTTAERALQAANAAGNQTLAADIESRLRRYRGQNGK